VKTVDGLILDHKLHRFQSPFNHGIFDAFALRWSIPCFHRREPNMIPIKRMARRMIAVLGVALAMAIGLVGCGGGGGSSGSGSSSGASGISGSAS